MDFIGGLREKTLGEVASTLATEGLGVGAGFIGASTIGRRIEDYMMPIKVTYASTLTDKVKGWAFNNVPKVLVWYLLRNYASVAPGEPVTTSKEILVDAKKAIAGSVAFDTILRLANRGAPVYDPSSYKLLGGQDTGDNRALAPSPAPAQANLQADVQKLIQENSALRTELNKALQRLASAPAPAPYVQAPVHVQAPPIQVPPAPFVQAPVQAQAPPVVRYQPVAPAAPAVPVQAQQPEMPAYYPEIRERKYGFMETPPAVAERERRYGFATNENDIASMFGMK